jgi:hypothetical protein
MNDNSFSIDAAITHVYDVPIPKDALMQFLSQPKTFEAYMPSVRKVEYVGASSDGAALYEWQYDIDMPLAPTLHIVIPTEYRRNGTVVTHHTPDGNAHNWMACSMTFEDAPESASHTYLTMNLHIRLKRASSTELHPLGLFMGQGFMSSQMQGRMEEIARVFVQKSVNALAAQQNGTP